MKQLLCALRKHRPAVADETNLGTPMAHCRCGKVLWEGPLEAMVFPGSGLKFGYRRVRG